MHTKCPECNAIFRITPDQLDIADGLVRCGLCDAVFNGKDHSHEGTAVASPQVATSYFEQEQESIEEDIVTTDAFDSNDQHHYDDEALMDADKIPTIIRDDFGGGFLSKPTNPLQITLWTAGAIALALFFLGQITYWQDVDVLPRPWVDNFCILAGCNSDLEQNLAAIKILNRNIYTHPNVDNALMITSSFVNLSERAQPFPQLQIMILDTQGEIVAIRRFSPGDYLVDKELTTTLMQTNQPVGARLEILDPGSTLIAYEIEFY